MELHRADRTADLERLATTQPIDVCLERYPRDLNRALVLAESGQVSAGHTVLLSGLLDAREIAHKLLQRVYLEALEIYEQRFGVAQH